MTTTTPHDDSLAIALAQAALGREVFPLVGKQPAVTWQTRHYASTNAERVRRLWMAHPDADGAAWRIPAGLVVLDVDDEAGFATLVSDLPDAPGQRSRRGFHRLYRDPGVTQGRLADVADVKVGGKGYVKLYAADAFEGEAATDLPAEVVRLREASRTRATPGTDDGEPMGTGEEILRWLGGFARFQRLSEADALALIHQAVEDGRIVATDDSRPWTESDYRRMAKQASGWRPNDDGARFGESNQRRKEGKAEGNGFEPLAPVAVHELLGRKFRPLSEPVPGLVIEGLGMLVGGPKKGKSWLAYQFAVAIATGGRVLGRQASKGDVLYLALEDGERRAQSRVSIVLEHLGHGWPADAAALDVVFNSERGDAGVVQIEDWLARHPQARLVIIDTLQKFRPPTAGGKKGQYELDVDDMGRILAITQRHPGLAILLVHHDRKQDAEDFLDAASGTHGITGSVDTALVLKRDRFSQQGTISVTGRDVREELIHFAYDESDPFFTVDEDRGLDDRDRQYLKFFREHGPAGPTKAGASVYPTQDRTNAHRTIRRLVERGILRALENGEYDAWPFNPPAPTPPDNGDNNDNDDNGDNDDNEG